MDRQTDDSQEKAKSRQVQDEIVVRDGIPAPLLDAGAPPSDPLCDSCGVFLIAYRMLAHRTRVSLALFYFILLRLRGDKVTCLRLLVYILVTLHCSTTARIGAPVPSRAPLAVFVIRFFDFAVSGNHSNLSKQ